MKKDAFYFSHDYNAHNDVKILFMRQQLGMEGYGIYWFLIESLADAGGNLPMKIIPVLSMQMHTTEVKVKALIENFELFQISDNQFFSIRLLNHLDKRQTISKLNSDKGKISAEKRKSTSVQPQLNNGSTKERKGKEIKGKERESTLTNDLSNSNLFRVPKIPKKEEVNLAFLSSGGTLEMAEKFFSKHDATGWFLNGSPIVNFKSLLPSYISNFKNFNNAKSSNSSQAKQDGFIEYHNRYAENPGQ
jgi:hypothetical protein